MKNHWHGMVALLFSTIQEISAEFEQQRRFACARLSKDQQLVPGLVVDLRDTCPFWKRLCFLIRLLKHQMPGKDILTLLETRGDKCGMMQGVFENASDPEGSYFLQEMLAALIIGRSQLSLLLPVSPIDVHTIRYHVCQWEQKETTGQHIKE